MPISSVSASCFLPTALFSLRLTAWLARFAWFDGFEVIPFRGPVLGRVPEKTAVPILSAHGPFNPIGIWKKLKEFGIRAVVQDWILFPPNSWCEAFLAKLSAGGVSVNTYFPGDLTRRPDIYSSFQMFAGFPFDLTLQLFEKTGAAVAYDLCHARQTDREGRSTLPEWQESWEVLHGRGLVDNVHVQPLDTTELKAMWEGKATEIAEMLQTIGSSSYEGPVTIEVDPLMMAKILGVRALLPIVQVWYLNTLRVWVARQLERRQSG